MIDHLIQPTELPQKWRPFMSRKIGAKGIAAILILVFTSLGHNNSIADTAGFSGDFAPANWTVTQFNSNGSVSTINAPTSITITGPNNGSNSYGFTKYTIAAPSNGTVRFSWVYSTNDGAVYDYPQFYINGTPSMLSSYNNYGGQNQNGTGSYVLTAGSLFGFAVYSTDNTFGAATTTFSSFIFSPTAGGVSSNGSPPPPSDVVAGTSVGLSSIGVTANPVLAGGTLVLNKGDSSSVSIAITSAGGTIQHPTSGSATLSGVFSGAGGLTFIGAGSTTLSGANTYTGGTTVSSGTLQGNTTSLQGAITNNSTVIFDQSTTGTYSSVMSGTGGLTKQGDGTLVLSGTNTYSGGTTVSSGTLQGNTASLQGSITNNGKVVFDQSSAGTFSGTIAGSGAVVVQNSGTVVLTGTNTYSGGTTVSSGTLQGNTASLQGSITNNGKVVFDQSSAGTFSGTIAGSGAVVVQNSGTVVLAGSNSYSGGTTVSGGTLSVAGTAPTGTGDVVISSAATIMGTGTIAGNMVVAGTFKPGNSPGYLSVAQNVTLGAGGVYQQDIAGTTQASSATPVGATGYYSFLTVGGQLLINSGATLYPKLQNLFQTTESGYGSAAYVPSLGNTFRIATAAGGISGTFSAIVQPAGLASGTQFLPFYNYGGSNSLDLAIIPTSYGSTLASTSTNTQSVAAVLDKLSTAQMAGTATSIQTNLMYATATQTASSLASFAQGLSGEIYADTLAVIPQTSQRVQTAVLARISDTVMPVSSGNPNTGMPLSTSGITPQNPMGVPNASFSTNPAVNPAKDVLSPANNSVWGEIAYQYGNRSSDSNASGFNSNLYQAVFGADLYHENHIKAGAGFSLSTTNVSMNSGTGAVGQGSLFVYGKMPVMQDYVLDGMASFGLSSTDVTRNDPSSTNSLKARAIKGNDVVLSAGISRPFETDEVTITPYVRATWQMVNQSPFDEGTASAAALSVNGYTGNGVRGLLGVSIGSKNKDPMVDPYTYKVNLAVGADTNTLINPSLTANLAGYGTTTQAANVGNTFVQAGLYGTMKFADNAYAYAGVSGEARSGQTLYGGSVGLRMAF